MNPQTRAIITGLDGLIFGSGAQSWHLRLAALVAVPAALLLALSLWIAGGDA